MVGEFQFEDSGRTFTCVIEGRRGARSEAWWWFRVTGDSHRYAPFHAAADDTKQSVQSRIVAYYSDHLTRRAAPAAARQHWARRREATPPTAK